MAAALCFSCGGVKTSATLPCEHCGSGPTRIEAIDGTFTAATLAEGSLTQLGGVRRAIAEAFPDAELGFWAFLHYLSFTYPSLFKRDLPQKVAHVGSTSTPMWRIFGPSWLPA